MLLHFTEYIKKALDNSMYVGLVTMDLSKAFDIMSHPLLIAKLSAYGLSNEACTLLTNYLSGRKQRVRIGTTYAEWVNVERGVPQGSGLGPLLFDIFINDMFYTLHACKLYNYADDNSLCYANANINYVNTTLEMECKIMISWFKDNRMKANPNKFQYMLLKPMNNTSQIVSLSICVDEKCRLENVQTIKLLGITLDHRLNYNNHVKIICAKAARQLNTMYRMHFLSNDTKQVIVQSFIMSNFRYCDVVWHFTSLRSCKKIENIHERLLKYLTRRNDFTYQELLKYTKCRSLRFQRIISILCTVYKYCLNKDAHNLYNFMTIKEETYKLRNSQRVTLPKFKTYTYGRNSFAYMASHFWNMLPNNFKDVASFNGFKNNNIYEWHPNCQCVHCKHV